MKTLLVTGSSGLIGSEVCIYFAERGEVYNLGGGKNNSCSILEAFDLAARYSEKKMQYTYSHQNREGDHICYYSDLRKMKSHYPNWNITKTLEHTFAEIVASWQKRLI